MFSIYNGRDKELREELNIYFDYLRYRCNNIGGNIGNKIECLNLIEENNDIKKFNIINFISTAGADVKSIEDEIYKDKINFKRYELINFDIGNQTFTVNGIVLLIFGILGTYNDYFKYEVVYNKHKVFLEKNHKSFLIGCKKLFNDLLLKYNYRLTNTILEFLSVLSYMPSLRIIYDYMQYNILLYPSLYK